MAFKNFQSEETIKNANVEMKSTNDVETVLEDSNARLNGTETNKYVRLVTDDHPCFVIGDFIRAFKARLTAEIEIDNLHDMIPVIETPYKSKSSFKGRKVEYGRVIRNKDFIDWFDNALVTDERDINDKTLVIRSKTGDATIAFLNIISFAGVGTGKLNK